VTHGSIRTLKSIIELSNGKVGETAGFYTKMTLEIDEESGTKCGSAKHFVPTF